jgi:putative Mg2+ transporter-C (MgtC) family protein
MLTSFVYDFEMVARVLLACLLGGIIGWERERHRHIISAGIRTYGAIALGSCMFGVIGLFTSGGDVTRIAAQVVTGIGFLGGGIIFRHGDDISGLTTAATLWATASVGLAIAFGYYFAGITVAMLIYLLLYLSRLPIWKKISPRLAKMPPA